MSATASASVNPSASALAGLMQHDGPTAATPTPCGNGPTLRALVDVANAVEPTAKGKAKAKTKAKAKAKVTQALPKTPAEQRAAIRAWDENLKFHSFLD